VAVVPRLSGGGYLVIGDAAARRPGASLTPRLAKPTSFVMNMEFAADTEMLEGVRGDQRRLGARTLARQP
jgi:hypothetical protein